MRRPLAPPASLGVTLRTGALALTLLLTPIAAHAATPAADVAGPTVPPVASGAPVLDTGDSRSDGEGPGLVGSPVVIALGVVVLGLVTALGTLVVLRGIGSRRG